MSYDSAEVLAQFANEHGIEYPMLSDEGSVVITALGLRNDIAPIQAAAYGVRYRTEYEGVPHPGTFLIDESGRVTDRWFEESYRVRSSGAVMMERLTGVADATSRATHADGSGTGVQIRAWSADGVYRPWMKFVVHVDIAIDDGLHLYGRPIPDGFHSLDISVGEHPALFAGGLDLPDGAPFFMRGFTERFSVYERMVRGSIPITLTENRGPIQVALDVTYQACTEDTCLMPETVTLSLPMEAEDHELPVPPLPNRP